MARSVKLLDRIARQDHISEDAKQWLIMTLDPFHDAPVNCVGVPDSTTGDSVTQFIKNSINVSAPSGTTGLWDCHMVMTPFFANSASPILFTNADSINNNLPLAMESTTLTRPIAPVTIVAYPSGDTSGYSDPFRGGPIGGPGFETTLLNLNANFTNGDYRVVSMGFEVLNTTNELNVQGLTTVYRTPVPSRETNTVKTTVLLNSMNEVVTHGDIQYLPMDNIPTDQSSALLLPNTKQWKAAEGSYQVARLNTNDSFVCNESWLQPMFTTEVQTTGGSNVYHVPLLLSSTFGITTSTNLPATRPFTWANMDISGCFFTGLSPQTTLTVNWNICIERFPAIIETDLIVLAKPSPCFCPMAFELYKAIVQEMPVGVMQKENGLGDWFRDAIDTAAEYIQPIAAMIPHPAAQAISMGAAIYNKKRQENNSPMIVSAQQEKQFLQPVMKKAVKKAEKKEVNKEVKKELKPFLRKSRMSVMPSARARRK